MSLIPPPPYGELLQEALKAKRFEDLFSIDPLPEGKYLHWDELRHRTPPDGLSLREWWFGIKSSRSSQLKKIPLTDTRGKNFVYWIPDPIQRLLHEMDRGAGGQIKVPVSVKNPATRDRYIVNALIEESITSSQLEGAATTRRVAENMLRSERAPRNRSEWMILNNYQAMLFVQEEVGKPLTVEMLLELHEIVTRNTLDDPDDAGRFRRSDDIVIEDRRGNILHHPPKATELEARVRMMCDFANAKSDKPFVHPLVRAVALHFWLAYDHPFVDGNGRTARALFYWAMLSEGYWLTEFLSISKILRKAPAKYGDSFLRTETDDNDLTYFLLYQLEVLQRALDELRDYLSKEMERTSEVENRLQGEDLNHRQLALLEHALKNPRQEYTFGSHGMSHKVVYQTARTDLLELEKRGFLLRKKRGRAFVFTPAPDLESRLGNPAERKNS